MKKFGGIPFSFHLKKTRSFTFGKGGPGGVPRARCCTPLLSHNLTPKSAFQSTPHALHLHSLSGWCWGGVGVGLGWGWVGFGMFERLSTPPLCSILRIDSKNDNQKLQRPQTSPQNQGKDKSQFSTIFVLQNSSPNGLTEHARSSRWQHLTPPTPTIPRGKKKVKPEIASQML